MDRAYVYPRRILRILEDLDGPIEDASASNSHEWENIDDLPESEIKNIMMNTKLLYELVKEWMKRYEAEQVRTRIVQLSNDDLMQKHLSNLLREAVVKRDLQMVRLILPLKPSLEPPERRILSPLWVAMLQDHSEICVELVRAGADVSEPLGPHMFNDAAETPLHYAILYHLSDDLIDLLIECGADVNARTSKGTSPLFYAIRTTRLTVMEKLLELGARVDFVDEYGMTVVHFASHGRYPDRTLQMLAQYNADFRATDSDGCNALHHLMGESPANVVAAEFLIRHGVAVNEPTTHDEGVPLHKAAVRGNIDMIKLLVCNGANINARMKSGKSPLFFASGRKESLITDFLLRNGAGIHDRTLDGRTPLHNACLNKSEENIRILLEYGAAIDVENKYGQTPFSMIEFKNTSPSSKTVLRHFAKLTFLSKSRINDKDRQIIREYKRLEEYFENCTTELTKMKETKLYNDLTCDCFFVKNIDCLTKLARNPNFKNMYKAIDVDESFPIFGEDIKRIILKMETNCKILDSIETKLFSIFSKYLPILVINKIALHTAMEDLYLK